MPTIDFAALTLQDALDLAILIEEEAKDRYEEFADNLSLHHTPEAAHFFTTMAGNEAKHGADLLMRRQAIFGEAPTRVSRAMLWDVEAPDFDQSRMFMSARQAMEVALASEVKAHDFFDAALAYISNPDVRVLFEELRERVLGPAIWSPAPDPAGMAGEIRRMRERMELEIGREAQKGKNPKTGRGGLVDVEFAAQYLQLRHGHDHPTLRTPHTPTALVRAREAGLLREPQFQALSKGYDFLRRLELRLRIVHDYSVDYLPAPGRQLAQLARRLGYFGEDPGARLMADYARVTEQVRAAFEEVVAG